MNKLLALICVLAAVPFVLAACGGDDDGEETAAAPTEQAESGEDGGETVSVSAAPDGSLEFAQQVLQAPAGSVTFEFDNPASLTHDFCLEQDGEDLGCSDQIAESSSTLTANLEPGSYVFYCSVAGHREGGMEGQLTVK